MENVIFLSHVLDESTPTYAGRGGISLLPSRQISKGDSCNQMLWSIGNHVGTHVDAPRHFIKNGQTIDQVLAGDLIFNNVCLINLSQCTPGQIITAADMGKVPKSTELVLIKTGFERLRGRKLYWEKAPGLDPNIAVWLKMQCPGIRAVGMDIISVSSLMHRDLGRAAHREFLKRGILLIEDMCLSGLKVSPVKVLLAPLRVKKADAAPCSVFAWSRG